MPRDDGLFGGDVRTGLKQMCEKLLDLTTRNRLLSFKHSARSSVRVIDELPDVLFDRLVNQDKKFSFIPVQRLSKRELREYEADYRRDHGLDWSDEVPEPDVRRVAIMRNLDTSFEMPFSAADDSPDKHIDNKIQVLLYPENLEASLNNLHRRARLGIEETGVNFLHLAVGFLEWDDTQRSDQKHHAPLLLLPLQLERGNVDPETGIRQFTIGLFGEDLRDNLSLRMKLQEMGLALPQIEDDEGNIKLPEALFAEFSGILRTKPTWRIRRYVTLSMFQFGKMVMFEDLDPDRWGGRLFKHPIVSKFFEGEPRRPEDSVDAYEDLDAAANLEAFPIIEDADSSQHSVLVDAIEGKNLVVQGPPGTGKSQTITNLIAATMNVGKTVLFVSEKMAALEVVKRRLDGAGLGHFCLELHSHKTRKAQLIDEIRWRLELKGKFSHPETIEGVIERLEATRCKIKAYSELLVRPWGKLGHSVQDILAEAVRYRLRLTCTGELLADIDIEAPESVGHATIDEREMALRSFVAAFNKVLESSPLISDHPLNGVNCADLDELDFPKFWRALDEQIASVEALNSLLFQLPGLSPEQRPLTLQAVIELADVAAELPTPAPEEIPNWFGALSEPEKLAAVNGFVSEVDRWRKLSDSLSDFLDDTDVPEAAMVQQLAEMASQPNVASLLELDGDQLKTLMRQTEDMLDLIGRAETGLGKLSEMMGAEIPSDRAGIETASTLISLVINAPRDHLHLRSNELRASAVDAAISQAEQKIASIRKVESDLSTRIDLSISPEKAEAKRLVRTLQSAGAFGFLSGEVRQSKRIVKSIWIGPKKPTKVEQVLALRRLVEFREQTDALKRDQALAGALGRHFAAADTPLEPLKTVRHWYLDLVARLAWSDHTGVNLPDQVWSMDASRIGLLREQASDAMSEIGSILQLAESLRSNPLTQIDTTGPDRNLSTLRNRLTNVLSTARELHEVRHAIGVKSEVIGKNAIHAADLLQERTRVAENVDSNDTARAVLGGEFRSTETDLKPIRLSLSLVDCVRNSGLPESMALDLLSNHAADRFNALKLKLGELRGAAEHVAIDFDTLTKVADLDANVWLGGSLTIKALNDVAARVQRVPRDNDLLRNWIDYSRRSRQLNRFGLGPLAAIVREGHIQPDEGNVIDAFRARLYDAMARVLIETHTELREFRSDDFERLRQRYVELDREILDLQRARIAARVDQCEIPAGVSSGKVRDLTERALLDHIKNQSRPRVSVRQIIRRAGRALQSIKPCFMMGPLSVAQYLDPQALEFDLVVMDEASQMKPEDAMGAIARGKQIVIVGDTKQLPPTSFFDRVFAEEEEEDAYVAVEGESILEVASSLFQPSRQLNWHYRSRHESLIAFSNDRFYNNELIVFPSPHNVSRNYGVSIRYIDAPSYRNGRNLAEARVVAAAALHHMESGTTDSLGIVAMNKEQADLIDIEIERLLKTSPEAEEWLSRREFEPLIVKNLENIQGDERDVIFISFTYGPEARGGAVAQRFGPILFPMGWRRLNVLFTRARNRVVAFSSMRPSDIAEKPGRMGPTAMRDYIRYAETGVLEKVIFTGRPPDSAFEVAVADSLSAHGYQCDAQIGTANYYIDIGVRHPDQPSEFIVGIECDGAPWHSGKSVRDRDRIRQAVLEELGWNIIRIWSTDWYHHPDKEIERVVNEIEKLRQRRRRIRKEQQDEPEQVDEAIPRTAELSPEREQRALFEGPPDEAKARRGPLDGRNLEGEEEKLQADEDIRAERRRGERLGISVEEARRELIELREREIRRTFPNSDRSKGLLRRQMIDALLQFRPTTRQEFLAVMPYSLRNDTDGEEAKVHLDQVLEILEQILDS